MAAVAAAAAAEVVTAACQLVGYSSSIGSVTAVSALLGSAMCTQPCARCSCAC
jgi:hypothetical protein